MADGVEQVESLHRAAQAKLGITASLLAQHGFPTANGKTAPKLDNWTSLLAEQILELRELSSELTQTYYQLARWIETGYSLGTPLDGEGVSSGADLLSSFLARVQAVEDLADSSTELGADISTAVRANKEHPLSQLSLSNLISDVEGIDLPDFDVEVDSFKFPKLADDNKARKALESALKNTANLDERYKKIFQDAVDAETALDKVSDAINSAASVGAGKADSLVLRSGRGILDYAHQRDKRLLMYARGTSGNPCAFCAMLASRGFVYWSATSAMKSYRDGGMNSYHDNCHCFPIARWTEESELPALNAYFQRNWEPVTGGYSGKDKLNAWRRWINRKRQESRTGFRTDSS